MPDAADVSRSFHRNRFLRSAVDFWRLPEFDPVSLGIGDPSETTVVRVPDLRVNVDPFTAKGREHALQVLHPVVDHEGRAVLAEVLRVRGEDRPDRVSLHLAVFPSP